MFHGSMVALVTPMQIDGSIDFDSLAELIEWHIAEKTDAIVVAGTTGESGTLSAQEKLALIRFVEKQVGERLPVIAGAYGTGTQQAIEMAEHAMQAGVDACLVMTPAYIKPTQEGLYLHYQAIAKAAAIPLILYNVPGRTACDLLPETVERLSRISNIIGVKEASGHVERTQQILETCQHSMDVYSGEDALTVDLMALGAKGVISVTANIAPRLMHEMTDALLKGDIDSAKEINQQLLPLHEALFIESNPIPCKWLLNDNNKIPAGIRLPLTSLSKQHHASLREAAAGVLS